MPFVKKNYDAIVVLANLMDKHGVLNEETRSRVDLAVEALKSGCAPLLVTCGWAYRDDSDICIADAMRKYIIESHGVDAAAILTETASRDTVGDAVFTSINLAVPRCWTRVLVVTSDYHLERSQAIFSFVYGPLVLVDTVGASLSDKESSRKTEEESMRAFLNTFEGVAAGDGEGIYSRLRERHPFYNGDIYEEIDRKEF